MHPVMNAKVTATFGERKAHRSIRSCVTFSPKYFSKLRK